MFAFYLATLGISAGIFGAFAHGALAGEGYVPTFEAGLGAAVAAALAFAGLQLAYMGLLRLLKPTRDNRFLFLESLSLLAACALLPFVLRFPIPWPHPMLERVAPAVFLAVFLAIHAPLKLIAFYAALWGAPSARVASVVWFSAAVLCAIGAGNGALRWLKSVEEAFPYVGTVDQRVRSGGTYAEARLVQEGAIFEHEIPRYPGRSLTLAWANAPDAPDPLPRVHVMVQARGAESGRFDAAVDLAPEGWSYLRVPSEALPPGADSVRVSWFAARPPIWVRRLGLRPIVESDRRVLLAGPSMHEESGPGTDPNLVVVCVDGLASLWMSAWGGRRDLTPALDRLAGAAVAFPNGYTPSPDAAAAYMTLLTGINPLQHGYLGSQAGPSPSRWPTLPEVLRHRRYATAAFTEGEIADDLAPGGDFERGFAFFDAAGPATRAVADEDDDAGVTAIGKAADWIRGHRDVKFMAFVRVRQLAEPSLRERLSGDPSGFSRAVSERDRFEAALRQLDRELGAFIREIEEIPGNTWIVVTSAFGCAFGAEGGESRPSLDEDVLRVPVIVYGPGLARETRTYRVSLEDIAPTLATALGVTLEPERDGRDFLAGPLDKYPVAMHGEPLTVSMRVDYWRLSWETNWRPFTDAPIASPGAIRALPAGPTGRGERRPSSPPSTAQLERWRGELEAYLLQSEARRNLWSAEPR